MMDQRGAKGNTIANPPSIRIMGAGSRRPGCSSVFRPNVSNGGVILMDLLPFSSISFLVVVVYRDHVSDRKPEWPLFAALAVQDPQ